jgi:uncharacterized protein (TIGR02231 family)
MRTLTLLVSLACPILALAAPDLDVPSRIDEVTVYRSSARVTRVARLDVSPGDARVVLRGLPDQLDDDSVRVEGRGSSKVYLHGVSVERVTGAFPAVQEAQVAERRLEQLQDEDRALGDRLSAARERVKFVEALRSTYSEERAKNLAVRPVVARELAQVASFVGGELAGSAAETRTAEQARRDLKRKIDAARAELEKLTAKRGETTKSVSVELASEGAGAVEVRVSYLVPAAGWQPVWDARLAPESATVELAFHGSVWQRTGEDWRGVRLAVSTAAPGRALFVPELEPRWLDKIVPLRHAEARSRGAAPAAAAGFANLAEPKAEGESAAALPVVADEVVATVEQGLLASTFTAPRRETVDGAGQARKIALARFPLHAEVTRTAAPRLERAAFLTAKALNETGVPLLGGSAGVYVGDLFIGRAQVPFTPAGGELKMAFGADERIEIDRRVLERKHDTSGLLGKKDVWRYRVQIGVKSRWAEPVKLTLLDLIPVARDAEIEVTVLDGSTKPSREDPERPGVRAWELELRPREERVVELKYEVRYPRGFPVAGLE